MLGIRIIEARITICICLFAFFWVSNVSAQMNEGSLNANTLNVDAIQEEEVIEKKIVDRSVFYNNVVFNFEGTIVPKESEGALNQIAAELQKDSVIKVRIKGHTCNQGNDNINRHYSMQRATTIKKYLLFRGVKDDQMLIEAVLDKEPLVPNDNEENRRINRRVEIELIN